MPAQRRAVVYYDPATVRDTLLVGRMCWRCRGWPIYARQIVAYLLGDDGVESRHISWVECATCHHQSPSRSEVR